MSGSVDLFHKRRATGIGGSDLGCIMGKSPWGNALDVWISKRQTTVVSAERDSVWQTVGKLIEPTIAALFTQRTGHRVRKGRFVRHSVDKHMIGHPDGMLIGVPAGVDYKNVGWQRAKQFGPDGTDEVPDDYLLQCMHYMIVTGMQEWYLAALIGGNDFRVYRIPYDVGLAALIVSEERKFWQQVVDGVQPHAPRTSEQALDLYPVAMRPRIEADGVHAELVETLRFASAQLAENKKDVDALRASLMAYMGEHEQLVDISGNVLATWNNAPTTSLDTKRLRAEIPHIAKDYTRTSTTRRFLLKGAKAEGVE